VKTKLLCVTLLLVLVACSKPDYLDLEGNPGNFDALRGKWILINYWAIWCKPCRKEIPELNLLSMQQTDTVVVFGVNFDNLDLDELVHQTETLGIEFAVLREDPAGLLGYQRPDVLPTTYLFDPSGKLVRNMQGPQTQESIISVIEDSR